MMLGWLHLKHCSYEAGLARPEYPPSAVVMLCCTGGEDPVLCLQCTSCTRAWLVVHPGVLTTCFLCKPPTLPVWKWPYQTLSGLHLPDLVALLCSQSLSLTSHFPGSCLSLFDEEMLTLHIGALEGVSVSFLPPTACGS